MTAQAQAPATVRDRVLRAVPCAVVAVDTTGAVEVWNDAAEALYGWTPAEAVGRPLRGLLVPDAAVADAEAILASVLAGDGYSGEFTVRRKDRRPLRITFTSNPVRDEQGTVVGAVTLAQDAEASRPLFRSLVQRSSDVAVVCDEHGTVVYASPAVTHHFGHPVADIVGTDGTRFVHPADLTALLAAVSRAIARPTTRPAHPTVPSDTAGSTRVRVRHADGSWRWAEPTVTDMLDDPAVRGVVLNLRDVTDTVQTEDRLRRSEQRYRWLVESTEEGIVTADLDGRVTYANTRLAAMVGMEVGDLLGTRLHDWVAPEDVAVLARNLERRAAGLLDSYDLRLARPDGQLVWVQISARPLTDDDGVVVGSHALLLDVTEQRRATAELERLALYDALTDLANRTLFTDRLTRALTRAEDGGDGVAVLSVDIDHFKTVNDTLGHGDGDVVLRTVAERLAALVPADGTVARLGGDEFVLCVAADPAIDAALLVADAVCAAVAAPITLPHQRVTLTASVGVAVADGDDAASLLAAAEAAMYLAKERGRAQVAIFDDALHRTALDRLDLTNDLRTAVDDGQLSLVFQPVVEIATGLAVGAEALLRWQHPHRGPVPPDVFIPLAEQSGLILGIGDFVLREACTAVAAWRGAGIVGDGFTLSVNLSARQLADPQLLTRVRRALEHARLQPASLCLEVTETAILTNGDAAQETLQALHALGVQVAIDDFGTGYASLIYLKRFPVDHLKIDRGFVAGLDAGEGAGDDAAIVGCVVALADAVGVATVAEGVETPEQLEALRSLGCRYAQGYLFSRPVTPTDVPITLDRIAATTAEVPVPRSPVGDGTRTR